MRTHAEVETAARKLAAQDGRTWTSLTADERIGYTRRVLAAESEEEVAEGRSVTFTVTYTVTPESWEQVTDGVPFSRAEVADYFVRSLRAELEVGIATDVQVTLHEPV